MWSIAAARITSYNVCYTKLLRLAGAAFLTVYGCRAFQRAGLGLRLKASVGTTSLSRRSAILQAAAFTFLNPHVYLDTVLLMA